MKINKKSNMRGPICGLLAVCMSLQLFAAEVTPEQAQTAAENWIRLSPRRMGSTFRSCNAEEMETVRGNTGRAVFHAFNFKGGGFVVTSGDTRLSPIVAFSTSGHLVYEVVHGRNAGNLGALD